MGVCVCLFVSSSFFFWWLMGLVEQPRVDRLYCRGESRCTSTTWVFFLFALDCFLIFGGVGGHAILDILKHFTLTLQSNHLTAQPYRYLC